MVNVSEKTLGKLKDIKDEEEMKSLDGTIRHLMGFQKKKIKVVCEGCEQEVEIPKYNEWGMPIKWLKCECGHETNINPPVMNEYWWGSNWIPLLEKMREKFGDSAIKEMAEYVVNSRDRVLEREYLHKSYLTPESLENDFKWYIKINRPIIESIESTESWPEHTLDDINNARIRLQNLGNFGTPKTYGSEVTVKSLDCQFGKFATTYRMFFKDNDLTEFVIDRTMENNVVVVVSGNDGIQITGINFDFDRKCDYCSNVFHIHHEAVKLKDGKLVCHECYAKVFNTILRTSR